MIVLLILACLTLIAILATLERIWTMPFVLADIENAITAQNTVVDSVAVAFNTMAEALTNANAAGDSDEIGRIIGEIQGNTARLTTAVVANTPGGPAVVTPVPVTQPDPVEPTVDEQNAANQARLDAQFQQTKFGDGLDDTGHAATDPASQVQVAPTPADTQDTGAPLSNPDNTETANAAIGTPPASGTTTAPVSTPAEADPAPEETPGEQGNTSNL